MSDNSNGGNASSNVAPSNAPIESNVDNNVDDSLDMSGIDGEDHSSESDIDSDPSLSKTEKKEAKKKLKQLELKYNGKPSKVDLPFEIDEEHAEWMTRQLQMARMGQHKAQDYAALERDVTAFLHELQSNPRKALSNPAFGVDIKKLAAEILEEEIANSQKSPEEIEREEYKRRLKEFEEKEEQRDKEINEMKRQKVIEDAYQAYDVAMSSTLEKFDIPNDPIAVYEMAHLMSLEIKRGYEPDMDSIGEMVADKLNGGYINHLKKMPHDKLVKLLGSEVFETERKARVAKVKKAPVQPKSAVKDVAQVEKKEAAPAPKLTYKERFGI